MANRPAFPAYIDRNATNIDPDYASNQLTLEGFQPQQPIPSKIINTLFLTDALGITYLDYGTVRTREYLELTPQRWSADKLEYGIGASVITGGAGPLTTPVYYFSGYRIEIDEFILKPAGADPLLKPATIKPGRIWIYLDTSLIVDPQIPYASIRTEEAGPAVADNPGAGELTIGGVQIDGAGEITGNIYAAVEPDYELIYAGPTFRWKTAATFEGAMQFDNNVKVNGTLDVDGNCTLGAAVGNAHTFNGNVTIGTDNTNTHTVKGNATVGTDNTNTVALKGNIVIGTDNTSVHSVDGNITANDALIVTGLASLNGTATAGDGSQNVGLSALGLLQALLGVSADGVGVEGRTTNGAGVLGISDGIGKGVEGFGGPIGASVAGSFTCTHVDSTAVVGRTAAGAGVTASGVKGESEGDGTGVTGKANGDGYALVAIADLGATPVRSSARLAPQQTTPSTGAQGDQTFVADRSVSGKQRVRALSLWESYHSTPKGRVDALSASLTGVQPVGNTGTIALVQIDAEEIGDVLVVVRAHFDHSTDTTVSAVRIMDATAASTINGGGTGVNIRANDIDSAATSGRGTPVMVSIKYTLPADGIRQFGVEIGSANGTTDYNDLTVNVVGVY